MGIDGFYMGEELWKFERDVLRNEGLKILYKKILLTERGEDIPDILETERVGETLQERERELVLSGLQGPKHYWRWQFCPAAGTESCGDSPSLSLSLSKCTEMKRKRN